MEVFPLDDPDTSEVGETSVSQVEQMKSWDASFAKLEKMLQAACDTEMTAQRDISDELTTLPFPEKSCSQIVNLDHKRKRNSSESENSNESPIVKQKRTSTTLPGGVTLTLINPVKDSDDVSDIISHLGCNDKSPYENVNIVNSELDIKPSLSKSCNLSAESIFDDEERSSRSELSVPNSTSVISPASFNHECNSKEQNTEKLESTSSTIATFDCKSTTNFIENDEDEMQNDSVDSLCFPKLFETVSKEANDPSEVCQKKELLAESETAINTDSSDILNPVSSPERNGTQDNVIQEDKDQNTESKEVECNLSNEKGKKEKKDDNADKNSKRDDKSKKKKFERCNIRDIKLEDELDAVTLSAQKEEQERIKRLQEAQMRALQERLQIIEVEKEALSQLFCQPTSDDSNLYDSASESTESTEIDDKSKIPILKAESDVVLLENKEVKIEKIKEEIPEQVQNISEENIIDISSSSSESVSDSEEEIDKKDDDVLVLSDEGEGETETGPEDPNNSGAHTNDCFNLPDIEGRVLVNVGHPPEDPDIYLAPQIAKVIKPHQIGGIRFLYDNVVENLERYKSSSGFGCILAHSMGLGKTVQVVSFVDVFLRHTPATLVLCIVPINTIQNWKAEFDMWVPSTSTADSEQVMNGEIRPRDYTVYTLNENFKTMAARASLIAEWRNDGGVLLMGYEMYRMLALRKMPKIPAKKGRRMKKQDALVEPETVDQIKKSMDQMYEHIVIPGPDLVICDEGHRIKNSLASTSMALKSIKTRRRVVLTGYPLQNNLLEYWCMVDFVRPNYLGSRAEFCNMFERPISNGQCIDSTPRDRQLMRFRSHVLHSLLVGFVQRRGHSVLRAVLPKKEEHVLLIRMTPIQRKLYKCFVKDLLYVQQATNPLKLFAVCCKIWNHPDILYKLLQEKRAQEDIDLDIDIASTVAGSSASTAVKRKSLAKEHKFKVVPKPLKVLEPMDFNAKLPEVPCQGNQLTMKTESHSCDGNKLDLKPKLIPDKPEQGTTLCKEEYGNSMQLSGGTQKTDFLQNTPHDSSQNKSFTMPQYSQSSFHQTFGQNTGIQQCHSSMPSKSASYMQTSGLQQSYGSSQQYLNSSLAQQMYPESSSIFSQTGGSQSYSQQSPASDINQQSHSQGQTQYSGKATKKIESNFSSKSIFEDEFNQTLSQFAPQANSHPYPQQSSIQQYSHPNTQQYPPPSNQTPLAFNQESSSNPSFSTPTVNSQIQFNQQSQISQQFNNPSHQQYNQHSISQSYSSSGSSNMHSQQYGQSLQSYNEASQLQQYSDKNMTHTFSEQTLSDGQCHEQNSSLKKNQYPDHVIQQQFSHHSSQQFGHSTSQFPHMTQNSQSLRPQQPYSQQSGTVETPSTFSHNPNQRLHSQSPPLQQYQPQASSFGQQSSPLQTFSQCSPSQQTFSQHSPPLQQSPKQQFSMPSPTPQSYTQPFSQQSNHPQYLQQNQLQFSQETASQQQFGQSQYSHQNSSQQYPKHSSPQQQYQHQQPPKATYAQQFIHGQQYPKQSSPQQNFPQQNSRQNSFNVSPYSHQSVQQYQPLASAPSPFSQQGHNQFSPVPSQPTSQGQSFTSTSSQSATSHQFKQQLPSLQQYGNMQQPSHALSTEQFSMQMPQSKSSQSFNQQSVSNQLTQPSSSVQYTQATQSYVQSSSSHQGNQYQSYVSQQQNSFQQYPNQATTPIQPSVQIPSTLQTTMKQTSAKGKISQTQMKLACQSVGHNTGDQTGENLQSQYPHQQFTKQILPTQQVKPVTTSASSYQLPTTTKPETIVADNIKEESNSAFPSKCSKPVFRSVKPQPNLMQNNLMPYQQGQQSQIQGPVKVELESNTVHEPVVTPMKDRMDSSINYDWAIPLMKDYVLGVLENSHKMLVLFSIINKTLENGDKLLVFSQSLSTLDLLELFLGKIMLPKCTDNENSPPEIWCRNKNYFRLDGSTSAQEREKLINEFNKNENVSLFLLSTRAGCLGINLVGANRIVVMDASWNPCHDAQAVCRIYRYGQRKQCHIYRLVTDNSLEKRIYDRQVNKQGMSDRVVDELNPESNFTWKDVTTLIQDDEDDGPVQELSKLETSYTDDVLKHLVTNMSPSLSKEPFEHESLLLDRKDLKLTKQEKKLAKQSYEMAKRASMINIRTTYTYMPGGGQFVINNKQCQFVGGTTVRVLPGNSIRNATGNTRTGTTATPITASPSLMNSLFKQGVMVQKLTIPTSMSVPVLTPGAPPVVVPAGQDVLVLRTPKGVYLRLPDGRIIAVQLPPSLLSKTQFRPNVVTHFRPSVSKVGGNRVSPVMGTPRGQSIGIIKQTLQCGGTVRYLGPKNSGNSTKDSAPEVIDLSDDDDEPTAKKSTSNVVASGNSQEDSIDSDNDKKNAPVISKHLLHGKQITIRKVSPVQQSSLQLPNTKDKCELPLKLQQNQQITIMPITSSTQQNRQKIAPHLAQPVRVQQMLLQPQQGKRKPFQKSGTKLFTSLPLSKNQQKPHITLTPTNNTDLLKSRQSKEFQTLNKLSDNSSSSNKIDHKILSVIPKRLTSPASLKETSDDEKLSIQITPVVQSPSVEIKEQGCNLHLRDNNQKSPQAEIKSSAGNLPENTDSTKIQIESAGKPFVCPSPDVHQNSFVDSDSFAQILKPRPLTENIQSSSALLPQSLQCSMSTLSSQNAQAASRNFQIPDIVQSQCQNIAESSLPRTLQHAVTVTPIPQTLPNPSEQSSVLLGYPPSSLPLSSSRSQHTQLAELVSHKNIGSSSLTLPLHMNLSNSQTTDIQTKALPQKLSHSFDSDASLGQSSQVHKEETSNVCEITKLGVPNTVSMASDIESMKSHVQAANMLQKQNMQPVSHHFERPQNGQLHSKLSYIDQPLPLQHQHDGLSSSLTHLENLQQTASKKKKTVSRSSSKKQQHSTLTTPVLQQPSVVDRSHQFLQSPLSDHFHDHQFQPFAHSLSNSNFPPFQSYSPHKPLLQIQHPQPLHPLQHNQEHSLTSHLPHMPHIYPMSASMAGNTNTPDIESQLQRPWPMSQSPMPSFHNFGQSTQYYSGHDNSQFSFQSSGLPIPQPVGAHDPQIGSNISGASLDHVSNACPSEL